MLIAREDQLLAARRPLHLANRRITESHAFAGHNLKGRETSIRRDVRYSASVGSPKVVCELTLRQKQAHRSTGGLCQPESAIGSNKTDLIPGRALRASEIYFCGVADGVDDNPAHDNHNGQNRADPEFHPHSYQGERNGTSPVSRECTFASTPDSCG